MNNLSIDIIIPVYKAKKTIKRTLESIMYQINSEKFNIYLVNDCDNEDYSEIINIFKPYLNIKELKMAKNGGPGLARQHGVDNSNGEYIVFIDADDYFYGPEAIIKMYDKMKENDLDLLISNFRYERNNEIEIKKQNPVWLHGKMYKRKFLTDNKIKFNSTRANEDNGFNRLILLMNPKLDYLDEITYVYSENEESITRKNNCEYRLTGLEWFTYNMKWAMEEAQKRKKQIQEIPYLALSVLVAMYYYYLELYELFDVSKILLWSKEIKDIFQNTKSINITQDYIDSYLKEHKEYEYANKTINYRITFEEFLNMIESDNND